MNEHDNEKPRIEAVSMDVPHFEEAFGRHIHARSDGLTVEQVEKQLRMANVFKHMRDEDSSLLMMRHVEMMTLDEIAEELDVRKQTVFERIQVAEQNLRRGFGEHWLDPIDPQELTPE